ncbi:hypothetical protein [Mesotoga sp.]|uniref:hypothetical protein n=1 Tax=Mesotoga sp. TaxID=2053577 RepID=UPI00345EED5C
MEGKYQEGSWEFGREETDNPLEITMDSDKTVTAVFDLIDLPEIILEWTSGDLMVLGAPCTAPEDGLSFQYLVGDSDSSLTERPGA